MKIGTKFVLGALAVLMVVIPNLAVARNHNPGVMPINSHAFGKSYGVWGQEFAQWIYHFSLADFPLFQGSDEVDCGNAQSGKVWFLYGALENNVVRSCTIPPGKALFIAVNTVLSFAPEFGETEEDVREDANRDLEGVEFLEVEIDGVPLKALYSYRATSPEGGFVFSIEDGSILAEFGFPVGDRAPAIIDGYHILLPPLSAGQHTIYWASSGVYQDGSPYSYDITWEITVSN
jgi:hypothetical protein